MNSRGAEGLKQDRQTPRRNLKSADFTALYRNTVSVVSKCVQSSSEEKDFETVGVIGQKGRL